MKYFKLLIYVTLCLATLSSCNGGNRGGGNKIFYTVSGNIYGLQKNSHIVLSNNIYNGELITGNGKFTFGHAVEAGHVYHVKIVQQPSGELCTVSNGNGVNIQENITDIVVHCSSIDSTYSVGGTVSGLTLGKTLELLNNHDDNILTINQDGLFQFSQVVASGSGYKVTVKAQPQGEVCTVSNGNGVNIQENITDIVVHCSSIDSTYSVGGTVSGLYFGDSDKILQLINNTNDDTVIVNKNGYFQFAKPIAAGSSYSITVKKQPKYEVCTVANSSGTDVESNITNIAVSCEAGYTVGGNVYNLGKKPIKIGLIIDGRLNEVIEVKQPSNGPINTIEYKFKSKFIDLSKYKVFIYNDRNYGCDINNSVGTIRNFNITNINIQCGGA
jgi:hypothetical protein